MKKQELENMATAAMSAILSNEAIVQRLHDIDHKAIAKAAKSCASSLHFELNKGA